MSGDTESAGDPLDRPENWRERALKRGSAFEHEMWSHDEIVLARNEACKGTPLAEIAEMVGRSIAATARIIEPPTETRRAFPPVSRGYAAIKGRY